jgi:hypothetical protein
MKGLHTKDAQKSAPPLLVNEEQQQESLEERFLPDYIVNFRRIIYRKADEVILECMEYLVQEYHITFTNQETKTIVKELNHLIEKRYLLLGPSNQFRIPFKLSLEGVSLFIKDTKSAVTQIISPAIRKALRFMFKIDLPKFFKGFLVQFNDMVVIYHKFLHQKFNLKNEMKTKCGDDDEEMINLFLYSELQRSHELHVNISLTEAVGEINKENDYIFSVLKILKRSFFSNGLFVQIFKEALGAQKDEEGMDVFAHLFVEPILEILSIDSVADKIRRQVNHFTSPNYVNMRIIEIIKIRYPSIYYSVWNEFLEESMETNTDSDSSRSSLNDALNASRYESTSAILDEEKAQGVNNEENVRKNHPWHPAISTPDSQKKLSEKLLVRVSKEILLSDTKSSIWKTVLGYEKLAIMAIMQLFELLQRPIFVKNLLYQTIDFIIHEIQGNSFIHLHQKHVLNHLKNHGNATSSSTPGRVDSMDFSTFENYLDNSQENTRHKLEFFRNLFRKNRNIFYEEDFSNVQEDIKSTENNFRSLFEYLQGNFATTLAKNLVDLINFQEFQLKGSEEGFRSLNENSQTKGANSWTTVISTKILNVGSNIYGVSDLIGEFLVASIQEALGPSLLLHVGTVEEIILKFLDSAVTALRKETEECKQLHNVFEAIVRSSSGEKFLNHLEQIYSLEKKKRAEGKIAEQGEDKQTVEYLEALVDSLNELEAKALIGGLIAKAVAVKGSIDDNPAVTKLWYRLLYSMERYKYKMGLFKRLSWSFDRN